MNKRIKHYLMLFALLLFGGVTCYAQGQKVTVDLSNVTLERVFSAIEQQTTYRFSYADGVVDNKNDVTVKRKNASVNVVLDDALRNRNLKYEIVSSRSIVIAVKDTKATQGKKMTVKGVVKDASGNPLIGATVTVKGTSTIAITDIDGSFSLQAMPGDRLDVTYIGYQAKSIKAQENVDITLTEDTQMLEEVVVVGYGTMDKKELTSAISHISSKDFVVASGQSPVMMIQGKAPGVSITNTGSGDPNNGASIQIRGVSSRSAGLGPLIVIDGVPGGDLSNLNPNDIESFDILKDGAASAIYGTRGSNGVVLVTTKKGTKDGVVHTQYSATFAFDCMLRELDMLTATEYRDLRINGDNRGIDFGDNVDWLDAVSRTGFKQTHTITLSGGNAKTNYRFSADYRKANGIDLRSEREEYGARASINHTTDGGLFTFSANVAPRYVKRKNSSWSTFRRALETNPTTPIMDPDNPGKYTNFSGSQTEAINPVELLKLEKDDATDKILEWNASAKFNIFPMLLKNGEGNHSLNTMVTYADKQVSHFTGWFRPSTSTLCDQSGRDGQANRQYTEAKVHNLEWITNYMTSLNDHNIKAMVGYSYQYENYAGLYAENSDFPNDGLTYDKLQSGEYMMKEGETGFSTYRNDSKLISFFGRVSYDWKGRYLFTASLRHEGSSKFGANHKWGNFPAVSAGWRISDESFMKGVDWINDLKLRADYGVTGNQNFDSYKSLDTMQGYGYYQSNGRTFQVWGPAKNVNPDLKWEKGKNWNVGIDFSILNNRVWGTFNYFNRRQEDLLGDYNVPVPPYLFTQTFVNVGTMKNTGIEGEIHWKAIDTKDFTWEASILGSTMDNEFVDFSNSEYVGQNYYDVVKTEAPYPYFYLQRIEKGRRIGSYYMYRYAGHDTEGNWLIYDKDGDVKLASTGTDEDKCFVGNGLPKFTGSMTHNFRYKNFDLSLFFRGAFGYDIFNIHDFYYGTRNFSGNVLKKAYDSNKLIGADATPVVCDYFLESGDYLKLDMVTIGYTWNPQRKHLKKIRVYGTVKNLATFTNFKGVDPTSYDVNGLYPGATGSRTYYPQTRQFILGVQVDF